MSGKTHGMSSDNHPDKRIYTIWKKMNARCYREKDPSYYNYGARGISVCKEWRKDYAVFHNWALNNGYQPDLTLDRRENDGNYGPDNCRWATREVQNNNTRRNIYVTYNNETKTATQWGIHFGITTTALCKRLKKMTFEQAIKKPFRKSKLK